MLLQTILTQNVYSVCMFRTLLRYVFYEMVRIYMQLDCGSRECFFGG